MAVPFHMPNEDGQGSSSESQAQSSTTSATQTPTQSPVVLKEHLVQVLYEALALYSANLVLRAPCSASPPSSPSCCNNHCGNVFFSQSNVSPRTPASCERSQQRRMTRNENEVPRRRLNSTGEEEDLNLGIDECPSATSSISTSSNAPASPLPLNFNLEEHYTYLAARERLQEFPGRVPQKQKKVVSDEKAEAAEKTEKKPKSKEQKFVWPTVVTAVVLAVGYISSR